jgi:hypothetical protein
MNRRHFLQASGLAGSVSLLGVKADAQPGTASRIDLRRATVVVRPGDLPNAERTAAAMLVDEIANRCGVRLRISTNWPVSGPAIAITSQRQVAEWRRPMPARPTEPESRAEGYRLYVELAGASPVVWIAASDARGTLFGAGRLLRELDWAPGNVWLDAPLDIATAPVYPIRGHQLGYRAQANSYDAWDAAQFEKYIRELTFFGINSIEGIPFQDERPTPVMKTGRREMNKAIGEICSRYGLDYWLWLPAEFDLKDTSKRTGLLDQCEELFRDCPVSAIFFPGGDPGNNPPELVLPFLEDLSRRMLPIHPAARIWISLQWFNAAQIDFIHQYIERESPKWFAGLVAGPSSPPAGPTRQRLPTSYRLRLYPDLTHNKLCQYEVPHWDQAYALTLGREAINPRPAEFAAIHNRYAPYSDGFLSYSDGVHDDVNKTVFSALSWDPRLDVRDILADYARVYFQPAIAIKAADAILALEWNWHGALADNGAVEGTLLAWRELERKAPQLAGNWRWQMCLLRTNYDAYVRRRLIRETKLESEANRIMAGSGDPEAAMTAAMNVLNRAVDQPTSPDVRARIADLCERLFRSIGLQTSVPKYHAIGAERGAILDFVDYPLNNRWWLEDEFRKVRAMGTDEEKRRRLREIATWENPGPGSFYDNPGNLSKSPHVVRADISPANPSSISEPGTTFWWWDEGKSRARLSWQVTTWPIAVVYEGLPEDGKYVVQSSGYGQALMRINGERVTPTLDGKEIGEKKEFPVDPKYLKGGKLVLTWDRPTDEGHLNWRKRSRLAEVWLLRKG